MGAKEDVVIYHHKLLLQPTQSLSNRKTRSRVMGRCSALTSFGSHCNRPNVVHHQESPLEQVWWCNEGQTSFLRLKLCNEVPSDAQTQVADKTGRTIQHHCFAKRIDLHSLHPESSSNESFISDSYRNNAGIGSHTSKLCQWWGRGASNERVPLRLSNKRRGVKNGAKI